MAIKTSNLKIPEPKPPVDRQPRNEKGKWTPPTTNRIQPKEQAVTGPPRPTIYMDIHRHVKATALDKTSRRIEAPARKAPEAGPAKIQGQTPAKDRFTKKGARK